MSIPEGLPVNRIRHSLRWLITSCMGLLLAAACLPALADVTYEKFGDSEEMTMRVHGRINEEDLKNFNSALIAHAKSKSTLHMNAVQLDSIGGNLSTGMAMGHVIRKRGLNTYVAPDAVCSSACVHVLIGGVERYPFGEIGVHRSTIFRTPPTDQHLSRFVDDDTKRIRTYISFMGLSGWLAEAILSTPSWFIRTINEREKYEWEVIGVERVREERMVNQMSRKFKIDRRPLLRILRDNYDSCRDEAKEFRKTIFECFEDRLSNTAEQ